MSQSKKLLLAVAEAVKADAGVTAHAVLPDVIMESSFSNIQHGIVVAPKGDTETGLTILAHEAGHVATTEAFKTAHRRATPTEVEFEASRWAFQHIRQHGGHTTKEMEEFARKALMSYALGDMMDRKEAPSDAAQAFLVGQADI